MGSGHQASKHPNVRSKSGDILFPIGSVDAARSACDPEHHLAEVPLAAHVVLRRHCLGQALPRKFVELDLSRPAIDPADRNPACADRCGSQIVSGRGAADRIDARR